ncbi:hypothetical protein [Xenorhabdus szentirmaii]|uniref:hypothetical protein n=1 Tax=Xenorhabdus szentirmaii TaxID=290112 RepID=UPI001985D2E3|nr:hypothetical protein [Xenorhabdus sp. CUL]MBD2793181.1 hypothetical protein [Xenorhabdus sp. CUL]
MAMSLRLPFWGSIELNIEKNAVERSQLEYKLSLFRARKYIADIEGISTPSISPLNRDDFRWHKACLSAIHKISEKPDLLYNPTHKYEDTISYLNNSIAINKKSQCHMLFEDLLIISFNIIRFDKFLLSHFLKRKNFDISLLLLEPKRVIVVSDDEYKINIFDRYQETNPIKKHQTTLKIN